jgi:hypothetical protein
MRKNCEAIVLWEIKLRELNRRAASESQTAKGVSDGSDRRNNTLEKPAVELHAAEDMNANTESLDSWSD